MSEMYTVNADFYSDWVDILKNGLQKLGFSIEITTDPQEVCMKYFNLMRRLIVPKPRKVLVASEFSCPTNLQVGLEVVRKKVEVGENLTPHLSRKISDLDYDDSMLNDWGIYHLHLGINIDGSGFTERTGPVLFVRFDEESAYFLGVYSHGSWTKLELVQIIHRNWPDSIRRYRLNGVLGLEHNCSDKELGQLRKAGVVTMIEPEPGVIYAPIGGGYMTSGISTQVVTDCDYYAKLMRSFEEHVKQNVESFVKEAERLGKKIEKTLNFKLQLEDGKFFATETITQINVVLSEE